LNFKVNLLIYSYLPFLNANVGIHKWQQATQGRSPQLIFENQPNRNKFSNFLEKSKHAIKKGGCCPPKKLKTLWNRSYILSAWCSKFFWISSKEVAVRR